jgi:hypothetical protein
VKNSLLQQQYNHLLLEIVVLYKFQENYCPLQRLAVRRYAGF